MNFTIITGISGAGRSSALRTLEDMGFFCTDNLPPSLIPSFANVCMSRALPPENVAVVADLRMGDMFDTIYDAIDELLSMGISPDILFLDANDEVLISRFKQTRRIHPVSGSGKILEGIYKEREKLQRIKEMANTVIDTSRYSPRALASALERRYMADPDSRLLISVITFGYKRGIPMDADLVFDMRFLPNPFYIPELRSQTGLTDPVRDYVFSSSAAQKFIVQLTDMVSLLAPCFLEQDKKQLVIGIGCTGGMHRSVATGEELFRRLTNMGLRATIEHRDLVLEQDSVTKRFLKARRTED